jgi:hypothetical protein
MKLIISIIVLLNFIIISPVLAKGGKSKSKAHPIKKIDTSPIEAEQIWEYGLETNIYRDTVYISPTVTYSGKNGWDIQIASYNIPVYNGGAQNYEYDTYINISKTFDVSDKFKVVAGTQNGLTLISRPRQLHNIDYILGSYTITSYFDAHTGPYWANKGLTTTTDTLGYTVGFNLEIIHNKLTFSGDYFNGQSNVSGAVCNLTYKFMPKFRMYIGVGVPETDSGNEFYGTVGWVLTTK